MEKTNKINFKIIQLVYGSLILGVVAFFIYTFTSVKDSFYSYNDGSPFIFLVPAFLIGGYLLSNLLFKKSLNSIVTTDSLYQKLTKYQSANIMRGAPLEAAGLMAVAGLMMTHNKYYIGYAIIAILLMLINFPSKNKFESIVDLTMEEKSKLNEV